MEDQDVFTNYKPVTKAVSLSELPDGTFLNVPFLPSPLEGKGRKTYRTSAKIKKPNDEFIESVEVILNQSGYDSFVTNPFQMKTTNEGFTELIGLTKQYKTFKYP